MIEETESKAKLPFLHESLILVKRENENLQEEDDENLGDDSKEDVNFNVDEYDNETNE